MIKKKGEQEKFYRKYKDKLLIISIFSLVLTFIFYKFEILYRIFFGIFFISLIGFIFMRLGIENKKKDKEKKEMRWVFNGSVGWLLFWLIVAFPIGIIYLIIGMERKNVKDEKNKK
jgi:4-hydroxybenzoate polyprenyltransferase